jgi:hypothetical protein
MAARKTCHTCKWCLKWDELAYRQRCRFPVDKKTVKRLGLPTGTNIITPDVSPDRVKHNCPAWEPQDEGGE